jgi:signal transduction histidine kinase
LCALDPEPKKLTEESFEIFKLMASLIAFELEADEQQQKREGDLILAEQTNDTRARFMSILGHDLRNPLSTIMMAATMLKRGDLEPEQNIRISETILRTVKRMQFLIDDLLDTTKAVQGKGIFIQKQNSDLRAICETVLEEFRIANPDREIEFDSPESCDGTWDAGRLAQVFSNLLSNAVHYGSPGSPIKVNLRQEAEKVILQVNNQGETISGETKTNLFTPFWRGKDKKSGSSNSNGLGLGLYIVKLITEAHGGTVDVDSSPKNGTTFSVVIPASNDMISQAEPTNN